MVKEKKREKNEEELKKTLGNFDRGKNKENREEVKRRGEWGKEKQQNPQKRKKKEEEEEEDGNSHYRTGLTGF